jgi:hypothetical protein
MIENHDSIHQPHVMMLSRKFESSSDSQSVCLQANVAPYRRGSIPPLIG